MADPKLTRYRMMLYPGFAFHLSDNIQIMEPLPRNGGTRVKNRPDASAKPVDRKMLAIRKSLRAATPQS